MIRCSICLAALLVSGALISPLWGSDHSEEAPCPPAPCPPCPPPPCPSAAPPCTAVTHAAPPQVVTSQAPGTRVHETGISFNDRSGDRLREWLGLDRDTFYDERKVAILPMGMCYPGVLPNGGDAPPRPVGTYAVTKQLGEVLSRHYAEQFGLSVVCLRIPKPIDLADPAWRRHRIRPSS